MLYLVASIHWNGILFSAKFEQMVFYGNFAENLF